MPRYMVLNKNDVGFKNIEEAQKELALYNEDFYTEAEARCKASKIDELMPESFVCHVDHMGEME